MAQYEATVLLVVISISLASVVYSAMKRSSGLEPQPVFVESVTQLGGNPDIERVQVNSSSTTTISSFAIDAAGSASGVLAFDGSLYSTTISLCSRGLTTFFSVHVTVAGALSVSTDGSSWVAGAWTSSANVSRGWQEVMIQGGTHCSVTLPGDGPALTQWTPASTVLSSIPEAGQSSGTSFTFYIPTGGGYHSLLVTTTGGFENVAV